MVTVIHLPPQEAPKQLTVHRHSANLEEHLLAFLNNNNRSGFATEEGEIEEEMCNTVTHDQVRALLKSESNLAIIAEVALTETMSVEKYKLYARALADASGKSLGLGKALHLLARVMGYKSQAGMLGLNKVSKRQWEHLLIPLPEYSSDPQLHGNIKRGNKSIKKRFEHQAMLKNRRDPNTIRLKDLTTGWVDPQLKEES